MSRTLSAAVTTEIAKTDGAEPRTGLRLYLDSGTLYYTDNDDDVTFQGQTYTARGITHSPIKSFFANKVDNCSVTIDNVDLAMSAYYAAERFAGKKAEVVKFFMARASCLSNGAVLLDAATINYDGLSGTFPASGIAYINGEKFTFTGNTGTALTGCSPRLNGSADNSVIHGAYPIDNWPTDDSILQFSGFMDTPKITEQSMSIRIVSIFDRSRSLAPWRLFSSKCNWDFCSAGYCTYNGSSKVRGTADSGTTLSLTDTALVGISSMVGAVVRFSVGTNRGSVRYVSAHDGGTGQISWLDALSAACDTTTQYVLECDKSKASCAGFGNTVNFGGYADQPSYEKTTMRTQYDLSYFEGWANVKPGNIVRDGEPLPIIYGYGMALGKLIAAGRYEQTAYYQDTRLYAFCEGEITSATVYVNGTALSASDATKFQLKTGASGQVLAESDMTTWDLPASNYYVKNTAFCAIKSTISPNSYGLISDYYFHLLQLEASEDKVTALVRGLKVQKYLADGSLDGAAAWSANPVWCIVDFVMNRSMQKLTSSQIDFALCKTAADLCNTLGYKLNLTLSDRTDEVKILDWMLTACRGFISYPAGKFGVNVETTGAVAQAFTMDTAPMIANDSFEAWEEELNERPNRIIVKYLDQEARENVALLTQYAAAADATIYYGDLAGTFAASGTMYIGAESFTYTGKTDTTLTGCSARTKAYRAGFPLYQGAQFFPERTAIYNDWEDQEEKKRTIDKEIDGRAIPNYDQAYQIAAYHGEKQVAGNLFCRFRGMMDSLARTPGDIISVSHDVTGWVAEEFRIIESSETQDEEVDYLCQVYDARFYTQASVDPGSLVSTTLPNPYAVLTNVQTLSLVESAGVYTDGTYRIILTLSYALPSDKTAQSYGPPHIYCSTTGAAPWTDLGYDTSMGGGFQFSLGFKAGDTVTVKVVGVNKVGIEMDLSAAASASLGVLGKLLPPSDVPTFTANPEGITAKLSWTHITDPDLAGYEIRVGASWAAGTVVVSGVTTNSYNWIPNQSGSLTFWIKAIDTSGIYSTNATSAALAIVPAAISGLSWEVVDNNVLLRWTGVPGTYPIDSYEVRRGATYGGATIIGTFKGTFYSSFEMSGGTYTYWITPQDSAGLDGTYSSTTATVNEPPDFQIIDSWDDAFGGTLTKIYYDASDARYYAPIDVTTDIDTHFGAEGIVDMQDWVDLGGYTYAGEPSESTAQYVETYDIGAVVGSGVCTVDLNYSNLVGTADITPKISFSSDDITYTDNPGSWTAFGSSFRYVKVTLDFAATGSEILSMTSLSVRVTVKKVYDAGYDTVSSAAAGKVVQFNKSYADVISIGVTPKATAFRVGIYDFTDRYSATRASSTTGIVKVATGEGAYWAANDWIRVPLPDGTYEVTQVTSVSTDDLNVSPALSAAPSTGVQCYHASFKVWLYDSAGTTQTGDFSWDVTGVE